MHNNLYVVSYGTYLSEAGANSQKIKYIPENSVIVSCIGANAGEIAITSTLCQTNQQINSVITDYYCYIYLYLKNKKRELRSLGEGGSTMININKSSFENFIVRLPEFDELKKIELNLRSIFNNILVNQREIEELSKLRNILLPKLMSGELDVSNLDI